MTNESNRPGVAIVGGGVGAHVLATTLRSRGYDQPIDILTEENDIPYDRPALSTEGLLSGSAETGSFGVAYDEMDIRVHRGIRVEGVGPGHLDTNEGPRAYGSLVLATGSTPLTIPGQNDVGTIHTLRTRDDARRIHAQLVNRPDVTIVGAGWIGAETASAAAQLGCNVTVVDAGSSPLAGALPSVLGDLTAQWYEQAGVRLRLDARVESIADDGVTLAGGEHIKSDLVVVGIGARPATDFLRDNQIGIELGDDGSVMVDSELRASGSTVFAIGDIARWDSARYGDIRTEHWDNAVQSAMNVAGSLLGTSSPYDPVPYFWSDQFGHKIQYVGHHSPADRVVIEDAHSDHGPIAWWLKDDRLTAAFAVDQPRVIRSAKRAIERGLGVEHTGVLEQVLAAPR